jgi:hypothetical protein
MGASKGNKWLFYFFVSYGTKYWFHFFCSSRRASLMQRRCLRFFAKIMLRNFCNHAFGATEPQKAPNP